MRFQNLGIFALLLLIIVVTTSLQPTFAAPQNLRSIVRDTGLYGLISIGVALVIITGGIDLSIGSLIALCGVLFVQVVNVQTVDTDFESEIVETRAVVEAPFGGPALLLKDDLPDIRKGDLLSFASTTGR
jgi:ribose transport system permease protein